MKIDFFYMVKNNSTGVYLEILFLWVLEYISYW